MTCKLCGQWIKPGSVAAMRGYCPMCWISCPICQLITIGDDELICEKCLHKKDK